MKIFPLVLVLLFAVGLTIPVFDHAKSATPYPSPGPASGVQNLPVKPERAPPAKTPMRSTTTPARVGGKCTPQQCSQIKAACLRKCPACNPSGGSCSTHFSCADQCLSISCEGAC
jgi:hypothetical protein